MTSSVLLDSAGTPAWDNMCRRTRSIFQPSREYVTSGTHGRQLREKGFHYAAGKMFFDRFKKWRMSNPDKKVVLVGHSMGSIVINQVFRHYDDIKVDNIVFMAAACSINDFNDTTGRYLRGHPETQFHNLCLHPRAEVDEDHNVLRGSLLVWIDQHFEGPRHFTSRTFGSFENVILAYDSLPRIPNIHLKAFAHDGSGANGSRGPQKHGDFSSYKFWRPSFWGSSNESAISEHLRLTCRTVDR